MTTSPTTLVEQAPSPATGSAVAKANENWWHAGDFAVFGAWLGIVAFTLRHHEKWADEAQAWLIARDLDLRTIWLHEARYEGSPPLWHTILWIAQHVFHTKYQALGLIGMAGAAAGAGLLIFKAPFPRYIRWPLAFTYVMVYQYAVIVRPYTLLPLLAFTAALVFKDLRRPGRITAVFVLMAYLCLHGTIIAGCLGLAYLIDAARTWPTLDASVRRQYWVCIAVLLATFVSIVLMLKPTPDIEEFAFKREISQMSPARKAQFPSTWKKLEAVTCGAFLDYPLPSALFIVLAGSWSVVRRRVLVFVVPVGALILLYAAVHGAAHHHGTVFIAAITGLWIAWPPPVEPIGPGARERWAQRGVIALVLCLCAVNIWDAAVVIDRERRYPYSGAEDAVRYLTAAGAPQGPMFGLLYGIVGIQAYFDHNIFANVPTAYFHHGVPLAGTSLNVDDLRRVRPEYVVAYSQDPELMLRVGLSELIAEGYEVVHFSDGYYLYKRSVYEREVYFILRRVGAGDNSSLK